MKLRFRRLLEGLGSFASRDPGGWSFAPGFFERSSQNTSAPQLVAFRRRYFPRAITAAPVWSHDHDSPCFVHDEDLDARLRRHRVTSPFGHSRAS